MTLSSRPVWQHPWVFILAAAGSAVGLGNLWKFPYIVGENGGGAFILVYLVCITLMGLPILFAEAFVGQRAQANPVSAVGQLASASKRSPRWAGIGALGMITGALILSFYSVVAGWSLDYIWSSASGVLAAIQPDDSAAIFTSLTANPERLLLWHTVFMLTTLAIVGFGVQRGLGNATKVLMPLLFLMLIGLFVYACTQGAMAKSFAFLFEFNTEKLTPYSIAEAVGHAFFTLSIGMGAIMAYGAYLPNTIPIARTVLAIAVIDTLVALTAGLVIFATVFSYEGMSPSSGPGLLFIALPVAMGALPYSEVITTLFFGLVAIAALSSAISLLEPATAWFVETRGWSRWRTVLALGALIWALGIASALSLNYWSEVKLMGLAILDLLDKLTTLILLPVGGLLTAIFVGWRLPIAWLERALIDEPAWLVRGLIILLRWVAPLLLLGSMVYQINDFIQ